MSRAIISVLLLFMLRSTISFGADEQQRREHTTRLLMIPVWQEINSRLTSKELFKKIMQLADKPLVTAEEIEKTFGMKFEAPYRNGGVDDYLIYVAKGDVPIPAGKSSPGETFSLFYTESKRWTLNLAGFNLNGAKNECVPFGDGLETILGMGWKEEDALRPERIEYYYRKETESLSSRLYIGNRLQIKPDDCLNGIQISNGLKLSGHPKESSEQQ